MGPPIRRRKSLYWPGSKRMKIATQDAILDALTPRKLFARLSMARKMFLGYLTLVALTVIVVSFAMVSLLRLNSLNRDIVTVDIPVQETTDKMLDAIIAQDTYEKRYLILKTGDIRDLFWRRGREFDALLTSLYDLPDSDPLPLKKIDRLHRQYNDLFVKEMKQLARGNVAAAAGLSNGKLKNKWSDLFEILKTLSTQARASQDGKMRLISRAGLTAFFITALLYIVSIIIGAIAVLVVTRHISSSVHKLRVATEHIADGNFDYDPQIYAKDEIGSLSKAFLAMGKRLRKLEEMYLDASPLTRLPGGIAIENVLKKRLETKQPIAFCMIDLDNFKAFNDRYGYARGSEVIKETARTVEAAVKVRGSPDDFVGHVGGDDFVVITTPSYMRDICSEIISRFDDRILQFYDLKDRDQGYILGKNRQGEEMEFPLMTISIAVVTNEQRQLASPLEVSEIAAELKDYAKTIPSSVYVVDKRRSAIGSLKMSQLPTAPEWTEH